MSFRTPDDRFETAVDNATHGVIKAFDEVRDCMRLPLGYDQSVLMERINDAITTIMTPYRYS